jgi:hypothetical protein
MPQYLHFWPSNSNVFSCVAMCAAILLSLSKRIQRLFVIDGLLRVRTRLQAIGSGTFHDNVLLDDRTNVALKVKIREAMIAPTVAAASVAVRAAHMIDARAIQAPRVARTRAHEAA